uniref:RNA helicase n=1 Tax=Saccoglossus kowalevskii TaxID=10224 RepID=A0ABM0MAJ4_SACKO|nr:PREDICTED: probable ATP-dependent RNA helicase DDX28-like [Saccoglossus kowalevskii]
MKMKGRIRFRGRVFTGQPGKQIIAAKRTEYSHYVNQHFNKFKPTRLASQGWKHSRSCGDHFTINNTRGNPAFPKKSDQGSEHNESVTSFSDFHLHESLINGLASMEIEQPTNVQILTIPQVMRGHNVLCAAETGSGKTLSYLLPMLHQMKTETEKLGMKSAVGLPRALVLLPARELAEQVLAVARRLSKFTELSANIVEGGRRHKTLHSTSDSPLDLMVATPGALLKCVTSGWIHMDNVRYVVIDEIDTMLDDSFRTMTLNLLKRISIRHSADNTENAQVIMIGATMPKNAEEMLDNVVEDGSLVTVKTTHLHHLMPHIPQKFIRIHSKDKAGKTLELVKRDVKCKIPVVVFCNKIDSCNWLYQFLKENNVSALKLNGGMNHKERYGLFQQFQKGIQNVLVCTDIGSRGLDTIRAQHVINFDFPHGMSDYIHRAGRVGRVGSQTSGHVTSLIVHKWDVDLVHKIERSVRMREVLPNVDANIKAKLLRISQAQVLEDELF